MPSHFLDLFSRDAATYAAARPGYPDALLRFVAGLAPARRRVWDCATGNGQAARGLAALFDEVVATDASADQIAEARGPGNVRFSVATAEASGLPPASVDAVTVAQALHWLDLDRFYQEVRRVTVPGGVVAAWSYGSCSAGADVDTIIRQFEHETLGPYWHAGRRWVDEGYRTIPFSFPEIPAPAFEIRMRWDLRQLGLYLASWSAVSTYRRERGEDPVGPVLDRIAHHWGSPATTREIVWPVAVRVGRVE